MKDIRLVSTRKVGNSALVNGGRLHSEILSLPISTHYKTISGMKRYFRGWNSKSLAYMRYSEQNSDRYMFGDNNNAC